MSKEITIYFTSDVHGHIFPTDYTDDVTKPLGLLAVSKEIEKDENTLLVDGGDILQGSPFVSYAEKNRSKVHPVAEVMNEIGYDYVTIGNHDFNFGQEFLNSYLENLNATVFAEIYTTKKIRWSMSLFLIAYIKQETVFVWE